MAQLSLGLKEPFFESADSQRRLLEPPAELDDLFFRLLDPAPELLALFSLARLVRSRIPGESHRLGHLLRRL